MPFTSRRGASLCSRTTPLLSGFQAFNKLSGFSDRKLRSSDASVWMRELLADLCVPGELAHLATHSCKATCLAWLTKAAAPNYMCRRAGYHVGHEGRSEPEYAHDAAAPLILRLDEPRLQRWHRANDYETALVLLKRGVDGKKPRQSVPAQVNRLLEDSS